MQGHKSKATRTSCGHLMGKKHMRSLFNVSAVYWYDEWALSSIPLSFLSMNYY